MRCQSIVWGTRIHNEVETMTKAKTATRDSAGRFSTKKEEANPDCRPATVGYVKRIARKVYNHNHMNRASCMFSTIVAVIMWAVWIVSFFGFGTAQTYMPFAWYPVTTTYLCCAIVVSAVVLDVLNTSDKSNCYPDHPGVEHAIAKYTPPVCEDKDECD